MKKTVLLLLTLLLFINQGFSQLLSWSPSFIQEGSTPDTIFMDATKGNQGLLNYTPTSDVYVHIGVITNKSTSSSDWRYVSSVWGSTNPTYHAPYSGNNKWYYVITGGLRSFFGITDPTETIQKIAILFRNGSGSLAQRNADGSDMYVPVYDNGLYARIDNPYRQPKYVPVLETVTKNVGDYLPVVANCSQAGSTIQIYYNGNLISAATGTKDSTNEIIASSGTQTIIAKATNGVNTSSDTISFYINPPNNVASVPSGDVEGINYEPGDTSVTLVIYAPHKSSMLVLGDFNNWTASAKYLMNVTPSADTFWLRITGLTPGVYYSYQYLIDNALQVADYNAQLVLDKDADPYIPSGNFPGLPSFPSQASGSLVSVFKTGQAAYTWHDVSFTKPDKRNLVIYELLVRDFVATQSWNTIADTLNYLKKLGVNAIEVMPFCNFEGASSWGYNPNFFFAPDKVYGTPDDLKHFVDVCHQNGIAVIMDLAMQDVFGSSPLASMYWNSSAGTPSQQNPWLDSLPTHPYNVGYQFNHSSAATIGLRNRVYEYWVDSFHLDGFRFDLAGGYTQTDYLTNGQDWQNTYDAGRVSTWQNIYSSLQDVKPGTYCILESFVNSTEQQYYTNHGMLTWGAGANENYSFNQATMGYSTGWDFSGGLYTASGLSQPGMVTYQESHDEERIDYKNEAYGNSAGSYHVTDTATGLKRSGMAAAFWAMMPGPKMLYEFEELGYDYSINWCTNGTIDNSCRTDPKPIRWDFYQNSDRLNLHNIYSKLLQLKTHAAYLTTFTTGTVNKDLSGSVKWMSVSSAALDVMVYGNFDVVQQSGSVTFPATGMWYNLFTGSGVNITSASQAVTLQPGEYYVYVNSPGALPVTLLSFTGKNEGNANVLTWKAENESGLNYYELQRSYDGVNFDSVGRVSATGAAAYSYTDDVNGAPGIYYYRLRSVDIDGNFTYSAAVKLTVTGNRKLIIVNPNPFRQNLTITVETSIQDRATVILADVTGREISRSVEHLTAGSNHLQLNVASQLSAGTYLLTIQDARGTQTIKVVKTD
ncbi:MAG TPA: alpha-amylase family glycosyl hydrolase [Chitinophagaceae bacterium]|nr:alpha-amylase family glycosyl hydrolase [Chitinophagaceae bacterium]